MSPSTALCRKYENSNFITSAHDKSDGMYANSVRQLVTHEIKRDCYKPELV